MIRASILQRQQGLKNQTRVSGASSAAIYWRLRWRPGSTVPAPPPYSSRWSVAASEMFLDGYHEALARGLTTSSFLDRLPQEQQQQPAKTITRFTIGSISAILQERIQRHGILGAISSLLSSALQFDETAWRTMTPLERAQRFPNAMLELLRDFERYRDICSAQKTANSAWARLTVQVPQHATTDETNNNNITTITNNVLFVRAQALSLLLPGSTNLNYGESDKHATRTIKWLPWRQHSQQRQTVRDLGQMFGLVVLWIPPIIGWIPTILAIVAPRQAFSRHFHNHYEVVQFAILEQEQRRKAFEKLIHQGLFFHSSGLLERLGEKHFSRQDGRVHDPVGLYRDLFESTSVFSESRLAALAGNLDQLPGKYIRSLALATGSSSSLATLSPAIFLRSKLRHAIKTIAEDDAQLLVDGYDQPEGTWRLTNIEVLDACLMRGLPIVLTPPHSSIEEGPQVVDYDTMRNNLTDHLRCMSLVSKHVIQQQTPPSDVYGHFSLSEATKERLGLFAAHLSILRDYHYNNHRPGESSYGFGLSAVKKVQSKFQPAGSG